LVGIRISGVIQATSPDRLPVAPDLQQPREVAISIKDRILASQWLRGNAV